MPTSVNSSLHKASDGMDAGLKVGGCDVGGVSDQERQRLAAFHEGLGVVMAQGLIQGYLILVLGLSDAFGMILGVAYGAVVVHLENKNPEFAHITIILSTCVRINSQFLKTWNL